MPLRPSFVFCADLHLDDGAWTTRPAIYGDSYCSFAQIVDYCVQHKLPLILAGDVLEKKSNLARPVQKLCEQLSVMQENNLPVFYIQGNHEYDRNAPWLSVHTWPTHAHKQTIKIGDITTYSLDWLPKGEIQNAFRAVPAGTDVLVTHQVWFDFMQHVGRTECSLTDVYNTQLVLSGDFHVTKTVTSTNADGLPIAMLSPGSTCMQDMGETPVKYFFVVGRDQNNNVAYEPVQLKTRPLIKHVVETVDEIDNLCAGALVGEINNCIEQAQNNNYHPDIVKPLVRVKFAKDISDAFLRVMTAVGDRAHLFCEALPTRNGAKKSTDYVEQEKTNLLLLVAELLRGNDVAYKLAEGLLTSADPAREVDVLFSKFMQENEHAATNTSSAELGAPQISEM